MSDRRLPPNPGDPRRNGPPQGQDPRIHNAPPRPNGQQPPQQQRSQGQPSQQSPQGQRPQRMPQQHAPQPSAPMGPPPPLFPANSGNPGAQQSGHPQPGPRNLSPSGQPAPGHYAAMTPARLTGAPFNGQSRPPKRGGGLVWWLAGGAGVVVLAIALVIVLFAVNSVHTADDPKPVPTHSQAKQEDDSPITATDTVIRLDQDASISKPFRVQVTPPSGFSKQKVSYGVQLNGENGCDYYLVSSILGQGSIPQTDDAATKATAQQTFASLYRKGINVTTNVSSEKVTLKGAPGAEGYIVTGTADSYELKSFYRTFADGRVWVAGMLECRNSTPDDQTFRELLESSLIAQS